MKKAAPQGGCKREWNAGKKDVCNEERRGKGIFTLERITYIWYGAYGEIS